MKKLIFLFCGLFAAAVLFSGCPSIKNIVIGNPDFSAVPQGVYRGSSKVGPVRVIVDVTAKDGKITDIALIKHFNGLGKKAEVLIPEVIKKQSLEVDAVSGATASSKAILKAIENALDSAEAQK